MFNCAKIVQTGVDINWCGHFNDMGICMQWSRSILLVKPELLILSLGGATRVITLFTIDFFYFRTLQC